RARRGDSNDEIILTNRFFVDCFRAVVSNVFSAFLRSRERRKTTGDYSLHHFRVGAEGRRTFARVQNAEAPRGSGADVKKSASFSERVFGDADCGGDFFALR